MALRPDRFCNYVYAWALARVEDREQFDSSLLDPLPGAARVTRRRPTEAEMRSEGEEFMSFMTAVNAG